MTVRPKIFKRLIILSVILYAIVLCNLLQTIQKFKIISGFLTYDEETNQNAAVIRTYSKSSSSRQEEAEVFTDIIHQSPNTSSIVVATEQKRLDEKVTYTTTGTPTETDPIDVPDTTANTDTATTMKTATMMLDITPTSTAATTATDVSVNAGSSTAEDEDDSTNSNYNKDHHWALDGSCIDKPHTSIFNNVTNRSCGFCGESSSANYLRQLRDEIATKFQQQCQDMVIYGVAFGGEYTKWLGEETGFKPKVVQHGTCFFQFVSRDIDTTNLQLAGDDTTDVGGGGGEQWLSADRYHRLILVDTEKMPYTNNRRNVKVLKMNPGLIFPWAKRIIWQDTKMIKKYPEKLPNDYILHFNRTVQKTGTCASYIGLPRFHSTSYMGRSVSLRNHCLVIQEAAKKRPTVSDNMDFLTRQCDRYMKMYDPTNDLFTQAQMIDSAFIVYDMQSDVCQEFNGKLGCSWLDEIHSNSDRDQISFPHVVKSLGLKLPSNMLDDPGYRDKIYTDEQDRKMMHVAKRRCHWYYDNISRCIGEDEDHVMTSDIPTLPTNPNNPVRKGRVAVIIAGTLKRFILESILEHFHEPMVRQSFLADYYISLTTADAKAYRSNSGYTDHFQQDPKLPKSTLTDSFADVEEFLRLRLKFYKQDTLVAALFMQDDIDIDSEPMLKARRERAIKEYPLEDPDTRFPIYDARNEDISQRTADANRNLLKLHLAVRNLWRQVLKREAEDGFQYEYVMIVRDDSMWLEDINMKTIVEGRSGDVFVPSCDARDPPMDEHEICDHLLISRRDIADTFGDYYSKLFETDTKECMDHLTEGHRQGGRRGCNSEMLLKWIIEKNDASIAKVGQGLMPFQRTANVRLPDGSNLQCFYKFCQSKGYALNMTSITNIQQCKAIDWDSWSWE